MSAARAILGAAVLVLLGSGAGSEADLKIPFCPSCWQFLEAPSAIDDIGQCASCSRTPVDLETCVLAWTWCDGTRQWLTKPCESDRVARCCQERESFALVAYDPAVRLKSMDYCPECRKFAGVQTDVDVHGNCGECGKPFVQADAVERAWYWCKAGHGWKERACAANWCLACCTESRGPFLALAVLGSPIADRKRANSTMLVTTEWLAGHLEEDLRDLFESAGVGPGTTIVAYCNTGVEASHTYFTARYLGYRVRLYDGSFAEWSAHKELPVEVGSAAP